MDDGDFKRVRRQILRREWEPQSLSGFISIHGNQQSDRRQGTHYASWKVFRNSEVVLREGEPMDDNYDPKTYLNGKTFLTYIYITSIHTY